MSNINIINENSDNIDSTHSHNRNIIFDLEDNQAPSFFSKISKHKKSLIIFLSLFAVVIITTTVILVFFIGKSKEQTEISNVSDASKVEVESPRTSKFCANSIMVLTAKNLDYSGELDNIYSINNKTKKPLPKL